MNFGLLGRVEVPGVQGLEGFPLHIYSKHIQMQVAMDINVYIYICRHVCMYIYI